MDDLWKNMESGRNAKKTRFSVKRDPPRGYPLVTCRHNAGFENISILDIANKVSDQIPSEIVVTESDDPRSYRLNSDKLLKTGFQPKWNVENGIQDVIKAYEEGKLEAEDRYYNMKIMMKLFG